MSKEVIEIRWHGRGGQGAKTAALLFGDAALGEGKYIQAFPEYGPERMGAPVQSFNRISEQPITLHTGITNPDIVVVLDITLLDSVDVTAGLLPGGKIILNTCESPAHMKQKLKSKDAKIYTLDANGISRETIGRVIPNTPMMGALAKAADIIDFNKMLAEVEAKLKIKFAKKPEIIAGNIEAIKRAYNEVKA